MCVYSLHKEWAIGSQAYFIRASKILKLKFDSARDINLVYIILLIINKYMIYITLKY